MTSRPEDVKCGVCGKQLKTIVKVEERCHDYEFYDEEVYYPAPEEDVHTLKCYVCADCFKVFGAKAKEKLVNDIHKERNRILTEKDEERKKYEKALKNLDKREKRRQEILDIVNNAKYLSDIPSKVRKELEWGSYMLGAYLLQSGVDWEKQQIFKKKKAEDWEEESGIEVICYPSGSTKWDWMTKEEFIDILLDCQVKDKTPREVVKLIEKIKQDS